MVIIYTPMRILITGGTGFIGSNLCDALIAAGHDLVCLDNNFTGSIKNIEHLLFTPQFTFLHHDIIDPISMDGEFDQIYHLACPASPPAYQSDPIKTIQTCTIGTMNVLEFAHKKGARILLTSTSEVYGDPEISPQSESYRGSVNTLGPRACYDEGKRMSETLFMEYHRCRGVDVRIARIFNTYGPRMSADDGRVITNFITQTMAGKPITIYGDGKQTRSFCYVDDTVRGLMALMAQTTTVGPVNIGNPNELTMIELARMICPRESDIVFSELPQDDPKQRCPDITLAKSALGWEPTTSLIDGLHLTVRHLLNV
jgi:UDP-glucuronate decarboxylase